MSTISFHITHIINAIVTKDQIVLCQQLQFALRWHLWDLVVSYNFVLSDSGDLRIVRHNSAAVAAELQAGMKHNEITSNEIT